MLSEQPNRIPDACLTEATNMTEENGVLTTRPVLTATGNDAVFDNSMNPNWRTEHIVTNTAISVSGKTMRVVIIKETDGDSHYLFHIYFLAADGSRIKAGELYFSRTSETSFFAPSNILFFSGAAHSGSGIFAMVEKKNIYDPTQKDYQICELSQNFQSWNRISDFYKPTVLINGRGSSYELARSMGRAFTGTPKILESRNLLNGGFTAYYTSDDCSSTFRLPFTDLTDYSFVCRFYSAPDSYTEWHLTSGATQATATYFTSQITLKVDRSKGHITFLDANNQDFPFDRFARYPENNIRVTAMKFTEKDFSDIVSCRCCARVGSKLVFSGGNQPNRVFCVSEDNPLYFSESCTDQIGESAAIKALIAKKDGFLALESDKIYSVKLTPGKAINSHALLSDNADYFYERDTFSYQILSAAAGCANQNAVSLAGKTPVWFGSDKKLHIYQANADKETTISGTMEPVLRELSDEEVSCAAMIASDDRLLLMAGGKAFLIRYHADSKNHSKPAQWYPWDFGNVNLKGGIAENGDMRIFAAKEGSALLYSALLGAGESDTVLVYVNRVPSLEYNKVASSFQTKWFDFGSFAIKKFVDAVHFSASCEGVLEIGINGKRAERLRLDSNNFGNGLKSVKIHPRIRPSQTCFLTFSSFAPFSVADLMFFYREESE